MIEKWLEEHGEMKKGELVPPSIDYQLGVMTGEYISVTQLPTLSTDMLQTPLIIEVSKELSNVWESKQKEYRAIGYGKEESNEKFYKNVAWYKENIENVYLKDVIEVFVPHVTPTDMEEFGRGVEVALWDTDLSHYKYGEMLPNQEYSVKSVIILKRDI